jgi:excisionase family DNA binding protein
MSVQTQVEGDAMSMSRFLAGERFEPSVEVRLRPDDRRSATPVIRADGSSVNVLSELGILEPQEVAELLKLRYSTVLDLSRRGVLPAFKIGKHWRYRFSDLEQRMAGGRGAP